MFLSIVIPAYNEEKRLGSTLSRLHSYLSKKDYEYEVIVVNNGSTDKTEAAALSSSLREAGKLKVIDCRERKGKGISVRKGILASKGEYILFSDADLSTPIEDIEKLFSAIRSGFDIAVGSRSIKGSDVKVHQPFYREYMGKFFNLMVQSFVLKGIVDTQCGFKLFKSQPAVKIAGLLKIGGFAFDVEFLYIASKMGYKIKEVPVTWYNSPDSRVNPVLDSFNMLMDLVSIKGLHNGI